MFPNDTDNNITLKPIDRLQDNQNRHKEIRTFIDPSTKNEKLGI